MRKTLEGFTLVEALVALGVAAICATVGVPALRDFAQTQRASSAMQRLDTQIASARMAAVTHGKATVLCPSMDARNCAAGRDWSRGWLTFFDPDGNRRPDERSDILHVDQSSHTGKLVIGTSSGRAYLRFRPDGTSPGTNLSFRFCGATTGLLGSLIVNNAGRARTERPLTPSACPL